MVAEDSYGIAENEIGTEVVGAALVVHSVVVELNAIETVLPVHRAQLLSYLRLGTFRLGYLLNFNVAHMREGIVRLVNGL